MALSVTDVKNIVNGQVGGQPLTPATTTIVEGRVVTPQISSVCNLGELGTLFADIDSALHDFINGLDTLIVNPIKEAYTACVAAIWAAIAYIGSKLSLLSAEVQVVAVAVVAALGVAANAVEAAFAYAENMLKDGLNQVLAACSFCSPTKNVPTAKTYTSDDFSSTISKATKDKITALQVQSNTVMNIVGDDTLSDAQKIAQLNTASTTLSGHSTGISNAIASDTANLAGAQKQNEGLSKMTTLANALNNPNTAGFANTIINPARAPMISGLATAMKA
jgi:hypothetical protein